MASNQECLLENGTSSEEEVHLGRTARQLSASALRKKSDPTLPNSVQNGHLRELLVNLQVVLLGTKLAVLLPTIPLSIFAVYYGFGKPWIFTLSLLALTLLAERISFLTEQISYYTGPTVGGLLNATFGNATELIIAISALSHGKVALLKYSLLGSVLSNLLLVLGTSLFCGGLANLRREQKFERRQANVNSLLLLLATFCHTLPMLLQYAGDSAATKDQTLQFSRAISILMLLSYIAFMFFQLWTHHGFFELQQVSEVDGDEDVEEEVAEIGFWSGFAWLFAVTAITALLSEYVVGTIEDASKSWGLSFSFLSLILVPILGNAAEHAGSIIFAFKNKLDISLGVSLGSATQVAMFVVPCCVVVAWIMGINMDLNFNLIETVSLALAVITTAFALQDGTSHYVKGLVLIFCYIVIGICFFVFETPVDQLEAKITN
ncbi:PREDICTED: vacuolar cation/proton exchanger [Prunus dulcis]|uniref:Vacuolar cation/proton exchanger n=1 Tax=Prunus dulcis TaxID=3755 RepID=A0A5E4EEV3_PRUDU|nr:vacuolar cation/proton exchanger 1-like [Prunus dulcis]XP_034220764.1 vacuolar cation/proton exchanger 1-like [Prunus dulcis]XP_034220765.1 vacuolar cation/proton exchanger 1-like [Prunus dulcis]XP_034220766.1 vacuolar cation/proton exchanger 1-like [Prunus dulcis]XP_034220768.1 vacuolar cation/proton exchanger 1-like [Prunus dulcis]XP_034220769.1 vacuolar cation/proton exchanger 1-like [Prunus dulcis]XP_034220770.1 vacuolar cation/proton exchanger 1-like [Prunus dulcis]XP_034220771.1 vac